MELPQIIPVLQVMEYPEFVLKSHVFLLGSAISKKPPNGCVWKREYIYIHIQMDRWPFQQGRWLNMLTKHQMSGLPIFRQPQMDWSIQPSMWFDSNLVVIYPIYPMKCSSILASRSKMPFRDAFCVRYQFFEVSQLFPVNLWHFNIVLEKK